MTFSTLANIQYSRLKNKIITGVGLTPSIPIVGTAFNGITEEDYMVLNQFSNTDILDGELVINTSDDRVWIRSDDSIIELSTSTASGGLPSLTENNIWIGDNTNTATEYALGSGFLITGSTVSVGIGTQSLQQAYDYSSVSEITTDNTRKALTIKVGSGSDTDNIIEGKDTLGATTSYIKGDGQAYFGGTVSVTNELNIDNLPVGYVIKLTNDTGLINGGTLSIGTPNTTFTISDGFGYICDPYSDPNDPVLTKVEWTGLTNISVTNISTNLVTFVSINSSGTVIQQTTRWTPAQYRDNIIIGVVVHVDKTIVDAVNQEQAVLLDTNSQLHDLFEGLGFLNINGNIFTPNGANLKLNKSAGVMFAHGANYINDKKNPHNLSLSSLTALTFQYRYQGGINGVTGTDINPNIYDNAGVTASVPINKFTIQRIYSFTSNNVKIQPGQNVYNSLGEAKEAIQLESFVTEQSIKENGLLRAFLVVKEGTTDLTDTTKVFFLEAGKFGSGSSVGGISVSTLQSVYNNSVTPEILTDTTRGAVTIQRGSTSDTDSILDGKNGAGTTTFEIKGNGNATFSGTMSASNLVINQTPVNNNSNNNILVRNSSTGLVEYRSASSIVSDNSIYQLSSGVLSALRVGSGTASGDYSVVSGGLLNTSTLSYTTVSGGRCNTSIGTYSVVSGGYRNTSSGLYSTISGGYINKTIGNCSTVSGGYSNTGLGGCSSIGGGYCNTTSGIYSTIGGGWFNEAIGNTSVIGGGYDNTVSGYSSTISGGYNNTTNSLYASTISGGYGNISIGNYTSIGGGSSNTTSSCYGFIGGGYNNKAINIYTSIGGGCGNKAIGVGTTIAGGWINDSNGSLSFIGGGIANTTTSNYSVVSGGKSNTNSNIYTFIGGGINNKATNTYSTIVGGQSNNVYGIESFIGAGKFNLVDCQWSTISGGYKNTINAIRSVIGGGLENYVLCETSTISGGRGGSASGACSTISGGYKNTTFSTYTTVSGGDRNISFGTASNIGGGRFNTVVSGCGSILGGCNNKSIGAFASIGGGNSNTATGCYTYIGAGFTNTSIGAFSTISGGYCGLTIGIESTIGGGCKNTTGSSRATVSGGWCNSASGYLSTISGGFNNKGVGNCSYVGGGGNNISTALESFIGAGSCNTTAGSRSSIPGGRCNTSTTGSDYAFIGNGTMNTITSFNAGILAGCSNKLVHDNSFIVGVGITSYTASTAHFNNVNIGTAPTQNDTINNALVRNTSTGQIELRTLRPRNTTITSSATPTPNSDTDDQYTITALAVGTTIGAPTGTPVNGQKLVIRIKDNGTARSIGYNAIFRAIGVTLPTTTVINKTLYLGCIYNSTDSKWDIVAYTIEA